MRVFVIHLGYVHYVEAELNFKNESLIYFDEICIVFRGYFEISALMKWNNCIVRNDLLPENIHCLHFLGITGGLGQLWHNSVSDTTGFI